ncbi:MAG: PatB family C-S lyase [Anaerolineae bacterium]|nr:PatB family C-S lyase [Anaerolineae bacterium]
MSGFDRLVDRHTTQSIKWHQYDEDVLPLWVADMDFLSPEPVIQALRERVNHGIFGYEDAPPELRSVICERLQRLYQWDVAPEALIFLPGVVPGFSLAVQAFVDPDRALMAQTPVYSPILHAAATASVPSATMPLTLREEGGYEIDFDRFARTVSDHVGMFLLCNPHNPVGRVFSETELVRMAELCLQHRVLICSDEIHCDLLYQGYHHRPIASLAPDIAAQTITLMAPSKTFNIAGLHCAFAVIPNPGLRNRFQMARKGVLGFVNALGFTAALAAYRDGQSWLDSALAYLEANRDALADYVTNFLPGVRMHKPEGTYLAWLDCRDAGIGPAPAEFFLNHARVALNEGASFGADGAGFVRLNFGCPRAMLMEGLERMRVALEMA